MDSSNSSQLPTKGDRYQVVARRYRPQDFRELLGQEHVTLAISNAITSNRVGHAYLFTGARGVGKTSAARILAKCLNCQSGPTLTPCDQCDICMSISTGDDVDVLEIDGASNRGIDEIRQLRANVNIRPSRARSKIFIIDEVHMLTKEAFNALLKTLEEPPGHVKFIFCTTDPEKIPITVLSRCQRFDFAPIRTEVIADRLAAIVESEGGTAEREALELLARRAAGSMRDSQSLLEQLLSYGKLPLTAESVHQLLGTARHQQVFEVLAALSGNNVAEAILALHRALQQGVDVGQFAEQFMLTLRDAMICSVGGGRDLYLSDAVGDVEALKAFAKHWGTSKILLALQVFESAASRMRHSVQRRTLLEMALVQAAHLDELTDIAQVIAEASSATPASIPTGPKSSSMPPVPPTSLNLVESLAEKKKDSPALVVEEGVSASLSSSVAPSTATGADSPQVLSAVSSPPDLPSPVAETSVAIDAFCDNPAELWAKTMARLDGLLAEFATECSSVTLLERNLFVLTFGQEMAGRRCDRPEDRQRIERVMEEITGFPVRIQIRIDEPAAANNAKIPRLSQRELIRRSYQHAFVQQAVELFDGNVKEVNLRRNNVRA
jgi:DNA polymerase III subunit gamma/tau